MITMVRFFLTIISLCELSICMKKERFLWPNQYRSIVGGQESLAPPEDDPVVFVLKEDHWGRIVGRREGLYPNSYYRFLGLRYAEPPVGPLRFQRPRRMELKGDHTAIKFGAPCSQPDPDKPGTVVGSEDCLFVNIFTPRLPESDNLLPVLFWIHGGGFRRGSAAQYGGGFLARRDLVVVTVQYRLGALGFLSNGQRELSGNAGMFDLNAALAWVREYIEFFGGDPNHIIPMGQGSGGSSATLIALSNVTHGRVSGVIAMSGSATSTFAIDTQPEDAVGRLARQNSCPTTPTVRLVKCLQQLSVEKLVLGDSAQEKQRINDFGVLSVGAVLTPSPVIEKNEDRRGLPPYLEESPGEALDNGDFPAIPLLTGVTKHETSAAVTGDFKTQVLDNLKNVPNFVDQVLVKELVKSMNLAASTTKNVVNFVTTNYKNLKPKTLADSLNQVIETTSDALFNFPAFAQTEAWIKRKLPAFFYTFEHKGKLRGADKVLRGLSLVGGTDISQSDAAQGVSHGSDLPYLFDLRSLDGTPDSEFNETTVLHPDDQAVRENFLTLIEGFAKKGALLIGGKKPSFPGYISIAPVLSLQNSFRECQMALWSGRQSKQICPPLQLVTSKFTEGLDGLKTGAGSVLEKIPTIGKIESPKIKIPGLG